MCPGASNPREKYIPVATATAESADREERFTEDYCYCCGSLIPCGHCGSCMLSVSLAVVVSIVLSIFIFSNVIGICTSDSMCEAGPGERARCRGICMVDTLPNTCRYDSDCANGQCYDSLCADDGTCKITPKHGFDCDDGSECTVNDKCHFSVCRGTERAQTCSTCENGLVIPDITADGNTCNDGNKCVVNEECSNGECVGDPVVCPTEPCKITSCDPDLGCQLSNAPDSLTQPDMCSVAKCVNGEYVKTFKNCFDGNPCTVDACFPLSGQCVHPVSGEDSCFTTCTHADNCSAIASDAKYACWDGNCVDVSSSEMIIRVSHAGIDTQSCPGDNEARLQLRFFMDEQITNGIMHLPLTESIIPLYPHLDIFDVETSHLYLYDGNAVRTHFSMRSVCHDLTVDCFPFINGQYEFLVKRYPCSSIHASHCQLESPTSTYVVAPVSVIACPLMVVESVSFVPELHVTKEYYTLNATLSHEEVAAWITDIKFCIPNEADFPGMARCILNEVNGDCPYRGCFGTPSQYLDYSITFLSDSNYTSAITTASNAFNLQFSRGYENYGGDRCENVTEVDSVRFTMLPISVEFDGRRGILDLQFDLPTCTGRRLSSGKSRKLNVITI